MAARAASRSAGVASSWICVALPLSKGISDILSATNFCMSISKLWSSRCWMRLPLKDAPWASSWRRANFPNWNLFCKSSMTLKNLLPPTAKRSSTSTTSNPPSVAPSNHLKTHGSRLDCFSCNAVSALFKLFLQWAGASPSPYAPASTSINCWESSPGSPPFGCRQNNLPAGLLSQSDCMNAFLRSPTAAHHLRLAAICKTTLKVDVVTVGAWRTKSRRSGSRSPLTHHLDFLDGGTPGCSDGFHLLTILEGRILWARLASLSCFSTSIDSSMLIVRTAPVASTFAHSAASDIFQPSQSSGGCPLPWLHQIPFHQKCDLWWDLSQLEFCVACPPSWRTAFFSGFSFAHVAPPVFLGG